MNTTLHTNSRTVPFLSHDDIENEETVKHIEFVRWIKATGGDIRKTKLEIYEKEYRGLHATVDIEAGEYILKTSLSNAIMMERIKSSDTGKMIVEKKPLESEMEKFIYPIVYIMEERANQESRIKPYLNVLPARASSHPAFFSEEQRSWLKGSNTLGTLIAFITPRRTTRYGPRSDCSILHMSSKCRSAVRPKALFRRIHAHFLHSLLSSLIYLLIKIYSNPAV